MWLSRGWRRRRARRGRNAWRMDQAPVSQVAWAHVPELTPRAAPADVAPAPSPWPAEERLDQVMPSVYCARCGRASPEGARFCSHCGAPLMRAGAERPGESTSTISLAGNGHTSFVLSDPVNGFQVTANKRGTIEFDTPVGGQISVLGIRFTPPNNALTTIPALANVGTSGGSIAHIASGGDGWQTTFVLVNVGTSAARATLSFFADLTGAPLSLPLSFPQSGTTTLAPSVTQTLAAGATLIVQSSGAVNLLTGSAQLSTTGNVSGFVIFRHNDQEAVVALESRNANAYILAFDNTADLATAVAINSLSTQTVNIPVTVRDDTGAPIATDVISLAPNGHYAFTMVVDKYLATAGLRGTIEFDKPVNGQIGVLGIRIPAVAHTFTSLPALAR